jgi:hypothetical protein
MAIPTNFDAMLHGPSRVHCFKCKTIACKPTKAYKLLPTGALEHLHVCQGCLWGCVVRYDPLTPERFIVANYVSPGKKWQWLSLAKPADKLRNPS